MQPVQPRRESAGHRVEHRLHSHDVVDVQGGEDHQPNPSKRIEEDEVDEDVDSASDKVEDAEKKCWDEVEPSTVFHPVEDAVGACNVGQTPDKSPKPVGIAVSISLAEKSSKEICDPQEDEGNVEVGDANVDLQEEELCQTGNLGEETRDGQTVDLALVGGLR